MKAVQTCEKRLVSGQTDRTILDSGKAGVTVKPVVNAPGGSSQRVVEIIPVMLSENSSTRHPQCSLSPETAMSVPNCGPPTGRPYFTVRLKRNLGNWHGKLCVSGITKACPFTSFQHDSYLELASGQPCKRVTPGPGAARLLASVFGFVRNAGSQGCGCGRVDLHAPEMADRAESLLARSCWLPEPLRPPGEIFAVACKTRIRPAACQTVAILRVQHS